MIDLLLYAPEYRPNLSNMIRSAEFFGLKRIYIYDENKLLEPPSNKTSRADMNHMARVWTAGAVDHIEIIKVDPIRFISERKGRAIATVINDDATPLSDYTPEPDDLIVMGPEKKGLPQNFVETCSLSVFLKNEGVTDCLNVSVMTGVMLYIALSK